MDDARFDRLTRFLGGRRTRRGAIGIVAGSLAGLPLAATVAKRRGPGKRRKSARGPVASERNAECAARCKELFPPGKRRGQCISDGAHGRGPCAKPVCRLQCALDADCCDEPGFGCCADTCTELDHDGVCPPPVCDPPSSCASDDECCGTDRCSCGDPNVCVQFRSLGTGACCKSDDECVVTLQCVPNPNGPFGVCCNPAFPSTCVCLNC